MILPRTPRLLAVRHGWRHHPGRDCGTRRSSVADSEPPSAPKPEDFRPVGLAPAKVVCHCSTMKIQWGAWCCLIQAGGRDLDWSRREAVSPLGSLYSFNQWKMQPGKRGMWPFPKPRHKDVQSGEEQVPSLIVHLLCSESHTAAARPGGSMTGSYQRQPAQWTSDYLRRTTDWVRVHHIPAGASLTSIANSVCRQMIVIITDSSADAIMRCWCLPVTLPPR